MKSMINLDDIIRQLDANAQAIRLLLQTIPDEQAQWKPTPETWSLSQVIEHVYNEERVDFRQHLKEMFSHPPQEWGSLHEEVWKQVNDYHQSLQGFLAEREASLAYLRSLPAPDWAHVSHATFGPSAEVLALSAGDVLTSWAAHDYLHIRQMNELLFAWNEKQAAPYSVQYAGGW